MEHKFENIASDVLMLDYKTPDNWDFSYHLTYNDLLRIINRIDQLNKPYCLPNILKFLINNEYISLIQKKTSDFIRKIKNYARKTKLLDCPVPELCHSPPLPHLVHTVKKYLIQGIQTIIKVSLDHNFLLSQTAQFLR